MPTIERIISGDHQRVEDLLPLLDPSESPDKGQTLRMAEDDRTYIFIAYENEQAVGYALAYRFPYFYTEKSHAYLYDIEVTEQHRRKGIGRLLIQAVLDALKHDGCGELWLGTATDNVEGQALFGRTGAIKTGETFFDYTYRIG